MESNPYPIPSRGCSRGGLRQGGDLRGRAVLDRGCGPSPALGHPLARSQGGSAVLRPFLHLQRGFSSPPWAFEPGNALILHGLCILLSLRRSFLVLLVLVPLWASLQGIYLLSQENLFQPPMTHNDLAQKLL